MKLHSLGPWHTSTTHNGAAIDIGAADGANVALVSGPGENGADEFRANARLIAAAPDLLNELNHLYRAYVSLLEIGRDRIVSLGGDCDPVDQMEAGDPALVAARTALTKAEGHIGQELAPDPERRVNGNANGDEG